MFWLVSKLRILNGKLKELNRNLGNVQEEVARAQSTLEDFQSIGPPPDLSRLNWLHCSLAEDDVFDLPWDKHAGPDLLICLICTYDDFWRLYGSVVCWLYARLLSAGSTLPGAMAADLCASLRCKIWGL
ncbi:hypothetical protein Nepgr_027226 [Nepenthes gracilis]|uniref:Uncharacterized protein n=1 Tax=Nepenthes gracilis TaxID=150966 RepID=A0AAD3T8J5_NEPGR|nr:hypothetical protein Nepgr_027226 [Nepenthes gracilis]